MNIKEIVERCNVNSRRAGWWENVPADHEPGFSEMIASKLMLIVSEASEALEEVRRAHKNITEIIFYSSEPTKPEGFPSELADIVIRVFDLCGYLGIDIEEAIDKKLKYNATRPYKHGGKSI
jgi:NTP pyrophosphatase (non-canonical NTP hydrolase)